MRTVITPRELSVVLGVGIPSLYVMSSRGDGIKKIPFTGRPRGSRRNRPVYYTISSVEEYINKHIQEWEEKKKRLEQIKQGHTMAPEIMFNEIYGREIKRYEAIKRQAAEGQ